MDEQPTSAEHHRKAAMQLRLAALQHDKAAELHDEGNHTLAAHFAHLAHGYHLHATEHANEAAKQHIAHS